MSGHTADAVEFLQAWSQVVPAQSFHPVDDFHFSFAVSPNVLSALALLDSVRKGLFPRRDHDAYSQDSSTWPTSHNVHSALEPSLWACQSWTLKQDPRHSVRTDSWKLRLGYASKQHSARTGKWPSC